MERVAVALGLDEGAERLLTRSLKDFAFQRYALQDGTLRVVMAKPMVTKEIYHAVAKIGICTGVWESPADFAKLGIKRVEVLNSIDAQGFAFIGGQAECTAMGTLSRDRADAYFEAHTVTCEAGVCRQR